MGQAPIPAGQQPTAFDHVSKAEGHIDHLDRTVTQDDIVKPVVDRRLVDEFGGHIKTDPREIALVRRIDWFVLPLLWIMYFFNFLDRNAIANAKLNGLSKDLKLVGNQFNTLVSILFVGYLLGGLPANMILNRVRPAWFMSSFMVAWSIITLLSYKATTFKYMLACRFLLGVVEAPFYPGAVYVMSQLYTRKELAARMSIFYTGNIAASAFSGLIAAGVFQMNGKNGLAGWQWLFIIQGALSLAVAIPAFYILPNSPLKTPWLTQEQREMAHDRILADTTNRSEEGASVWAGLRQAAFDWRTWVFCLMGNLHMSTNGFKNFLPTVINTFGYSTTTTLGLTCPPYILTGVVLVLAGWSSGRHNERTWHITALKAAAIAGFVLCVSTLNVPARYVGVMVFVGATYGVNNLILAWTASVVCETPEKRAVAIALENMFGNLASVYTPYLWPDSDAPRFVPAMTASVGFSLGTIVLAHFMRWSLRRKNRKLKEADPNVENLYVH